MLYTVFVPNCQRICCYFSVIQLCPTIYNPMDCSMPGFPVLHHLPEFAQTHVHRVGDAIKPSHSPSASSPAFNLSSIRIFSKALCIRWPKYWSFSPSNECSGLISFRINWLDLLCCSRNSQESSPTPQFKSINSLALSLLYHPTLTLIHDYWKNHSFDQMYML